MKLTRAFIAILAFFVLLSVIYYIHVNYLSIDVVFYAAIGDALIATSLMSIILFIPLSYFGIFTRFEKFQLIIIWLLLGYSLAISVPTVIDRSLSFYILEKLQQRGGGIKLNAFKAVFTQEYVKEHHLVEVRLTEQLASGTIQIENNCVILTEKGDHIAQYSRFFRKNFLPKQRLLMGEYTDVLTDPFRISENSNQYTCSKN